MVAVLDDGDVDVDDVAALEFFRPRDAVADGVVDRGADRLGEALVVEGGGDHALHVDHIIVADAVQFLGGDARNDERGDHLQHLGGEPSGHAHFFGFLGGLDGDAHAGPDAVVGESLGAAEARPRIVEAS